VVNILPYIVWSWRATVSILYNLDEKERVRTRFIVENTQFLHQISRVIPHGTAFISGAIERQKRFDSLRIRTFGY
jgi:hypothetical protein